MHKKILIFSLLLIFCFPFTALSNQKETAEKPKAESVEFYFNLVPENLASFDLQVSLLKKAAAKLIPQTDWKIPRATLTVITYDNSSTIKLILDANPLRDFEPYSESEILNLSKNIIENWILSVECVTNAKILQAQAELHNVKKYQKEQTILLMQQKVLLDNYATLKRKNITLELEKSAVIANMQAIEKKKTLISKAKETATEDVFKKELDSMLIKTRLEEIELQTKLTLITAMIMETKLLIKSTDLSLNEIPESARLSEDLISRLAETANTTSLQPVLIGGIGDAFKLSSNK